MGHKFIWWLLITTSGFQTALLVLCSALVIVALIVAISIITLEKGWILKS